MINKEELIKQKSLQYGYDVKICPACNAEYDKLLKYPKFINIHRDVEYIGCEYCMDEGVIRK